MKMHKIIWIYDDINHTNNPILLQVIETLTVSSEVEIIDNSSKHENLFYRHIPLRMHSHLLKRLLIIFQKLRSSVSHVNSSEIDNQVFNLSKTIGSKSYGVFLFLKTFILSLLFHPNIILFSKPTSGSVVALLISKILGCRLVYYPFELYGEQHFEVPEKWLNFEKYLLHNEIDALITQNECRAKVYTNERKCTVTPFIVHNYKKYIKLNPKRKLHSLLQIQKNTKIILYEGHLIIGRYLMELIESSVYFGKNTLLVFIGKASTWWNENAMVLLKEKKYASRIIVLPWMNSKDLYNTITDADIGIMIYDDKKRNNLYCEPGKLSDYVLAGIPVVAPNFKTISPIIKKFEIGETFDSARPKDIARVIKKMLKIPKQNWRKALLLAQKELIWETQILSLQKAVFGNNSYA